jgi:hypothetical protein
MVQASLVYRLHPPSWQHDRGIAEKGSAVSKIRQRRKRPARKPVELQLSIFFVDRHNYHELTEARDADNEMAIMVCDAVQFFIVNSPTGLCGVCEETLSGELTFIVMITQPQPDTLTSCICQACSRRHDLDDEFKAIIDAWLPNMEIVMRHTMH